MVLVTTQAETGLLLEIKLSSNVDAIGGPFGDISKLKSLWQFKKVGLLKTVPRYLYNVFNTILVKNETALCVCADWEF